jgi:hypothetical protein
MTFTHLEVTAPAMQTHLAAGTATQYGTWVSYGGPARIALALVLLAAAGCTAYAGSRLPLPIRGASRGRAALTVMLAGWLLAIAAFLVCATVYIEQLRRENLPHAAPVDPITPVTIIGMGAIFFAVLVTSTHGWRTTLPSAIIGGLAAPMIFEFPFDLVVMARTYPPIPPDPALYRLLLFAPLILIEASTLALLAFSPMVHLRKATCLCVASMLLVFAIWALLGFGYPSAPAPIALNVLSKILALAAAASLFFPPRARASTPVPASDPGAALAHADSRSA